jgi:SNF2 family DNA or RNA helicase
LLFAVHKQVVAALEDALYKYNPAKVIGGQLMEKRKLEVQKFIHNDTCRLLIGNIDAAGVGIDGLQHVCSRVLFAEINHSPEAIKQAIDRVCRRGQTASVLAQFPAYSGSVDQWMLESNVGKERFVEKVLT